MIKKDLYKNIIDYIIENQNKFYRLAYSYTRNQEDALDVVQNSVCKALEHYEELKNENAVNTWIYRIVVNESLRTIKENKKHDLFKNSGEREGVYEERRLDVQDAMPEITEETPFYMNADGNPVLVFDKYELAPGSEGIQEFTVNRNE